MVFHLWARRVFMTPLQSRYTASFKKAMMHIRVNILDTIKYICLPIQIKFVKFVYIVQYWYANVQVYVTIKEINICKFVWRKLFFEILTLALRLVVADAGLKALWTPRRTVCCGLSMPTAWQEIQFWRGQVFHQSKMQQKHKPLSITFTVGTEHREYLVT